MSDTTQLPITNYQLPLSRFLSIQAAYGPSFSGDGKRLAFLSNITGVPQAWAMDAIGGWPSQLTFEKDRVVSVSWSPVAEGLIFARDIGGNENTQLYWLGADASNERRLTRDDGAMHVFGGWSADGKAIAYSANRRERARYDIWVQDLASGEERLVWQNDAPGFLVPTGFSPDGARLLVTLMSSSMDEDLYELTLSATRPAEVRHLTPQPGWVRYGFPAYSPDGQGVYCLCDLERDWRGVAHIELASLAVRWLATPSVEIDDLAVAPDGRRLAWSENHSGAHRLVVLDLESGSQQTAPGLPIGAVVAPPADFDQNTLTFSPDGQQLAFGFSSPTRASDIWLWRPADQHLAQVTHSSQAGAPPAALVEPELIQYPTFDGRQIPAWYYRAKSGPGERKPVVVYVHGGPESQTQAVLIPILQYFGQQGFHVLAPNVRGSSGYGKTYMNLDNVEKRPDSVADLAQAVHWLRQQPEVDGGRIAVYGGSYGGYMVLAALTEYPDLWAAGVDIVGIANFVTFLENTGAYRRSVREAEYGSLEHDRAVLEAISPIRHIDRITAPLIVIHGQNDPRVPVSEAQQVVDALRARGVPVEFLVYPDEGHGLVKLANKLDAFPKVAAFLKQHLGG
jgi:dipeptidyl aminopeptidase/acylaminoacyl peptidase